MPKAGDRKQERGTIAKGLTVGCAAGYVMLLILLLVLAVFVSKERVSTGQIGAAVVASSFVSAMAAGAVSASIVGKRKIASGVGAAAAMIIVRLAIGLMGSESGVFGHLTGGVFLAMAAGGLVGGMLTMKRRRAHRAK